MIAKAFAPDSEKLGAETARTWNESPAFSSLDDGEPYPEDAKCEATADPGINPLDVQVGGSHYKDCTIQPIQYIHANKLGFMEGNAIKYLTRWRTKNGVQDLRKARHYIDLLIELEGGEY